MHATVHGCVREAVAPAIDELGKRLDEGQGEDMARVLPCFVHADFCKVACHLAEDLNGAMPRPPEAEVCETRESSAKVARGGSVVDTP